MPSQRIILGISLASLLIISAASIGLDVKSRSDVASVEHTLGVQKKISDLRLLIRRAESAPRGPDPDAAGDADARRLARQPRAGEFAQRHQGCEPNPGSRGRRTHRAPVRGS